MHKPIRQLVLVGVFVIVGCQAPPPKPPPPDTVTQGSLLTITKSFVIPAGGSGIYFQDNQPQSRSDLAAGLPYCYFALSAPTKTALTVGPQTFMVTTTEYDEDAAPHGGFSSVTRINLRYGKLAKPPHLSCRSPGAAEAQRFVTPAEIRGAMDAYFTLKLAQ